MAAKKLDDREARIRAICDTINKGTFGGEKHDAVNFLGGDSIIQMERFPSGCTALDDALGGGWPKGRFVELFGAESGGKTTLVLQAIAEHQKKYPDQDVAFIDSEYAFDETYAKALGVDMRYLIVHQPDSGEQALNILSQLVQNGVMLIAVDSVAALTTKAELEGDIGDVHVGQQARLMSQALRRLVQETGSRGSTVFWTNQMRDKIGVMYGDKTTTPAGHALKHYASIRVKVDRIGTVREDIGGGKKLAVCNKTKADVKKNKTAPPFRVAEFYITYGHGVDKAAAILDSALSYKAVIRKGAWFSCDGDNIASGRLETLEVIRTNDAIAAKINAAIEAAKAKGVAPEPEKTDDDQPKSFKKPKGMGNKPVEAADPDALEAGESAEVQDA